VAGLSNLDFETYLAGWQAATAGDGARVETTTAAARRGERGLLLATGEQEGSWCQVTRRFASPGKAVRVYASAWIRTPQPQHVFLSLRPVGDTERDESAGSPKARCALQVDRWHKIGAGGDLPAGTKELELRVRAEGTRTHAYIDNLEVFFWTRTRNLAPVAAGRAEQVLYGVDALRVLIEHGIPRAHFHHLMGSYPCGTLDGNGEPKDTSLVFRFFKDRIGTWLVRAETDAPTFDYQTHADAWASDFNAVPPDAPAVPLLSVMATRGGGRMHLLFVNRSTDRTLDVLVAIEGVKVVGTGRVRRLVCEDFDAASIRLEQDRLPVSSKFRHRIGPHTAHIVTFDVLEG